MVSFARFMNIQGNTCKSCAEAVLPLSGDQLTPYAGKIGPKWRLIDEHHLERDLDFPDFRSAMAFANQVADVAEELGHHPDMRIGWGSLRISLWTHKVHGLTEADFALASRIDKLIGGA